MIEYKVIKLTEISAAGQEKQLNEAGSDDWQLVSVDNGYAYFMQESLHIPVDIQQKIIGIVETEWSGMEQ